MPKPANPVPPLFFVRIVTTMLDWLQRARHAISPAPLALLELTSLGYFVSQAILAAVKLGVPEALEKGPLTGAELARAVHADELAVIRLMRALVSVRLFDEKRGCYRLNALSRQLLPNRPGSALPAMRLGSEEWVGRLWGDLPEAVRSGKPATLPVLGMPLFDYLAAHPSAADTFHCAMQSITAATAAAALAAYPLGFARTLIDVGGGLGQLLIGAVERYPRLRGTLFELPHTAQAAIAHMNREPNRERLEVVTGDFFADALPAGADVYVLMNILHDWSDADAVRILTRCRDALLPGSRLLIIEMVLPTKGKPGIASVLDLQMLLLFDGGRERNVDEFRSLVAAAGLRINRVVPTASPSSVIELTLA